MASVSVRIDEELFNAASTEGKAYYRSGAQQINVWAKVGRNALANPDLPIEAIADLLITKEHRAEEFRKKNKKLRLSSKNA